MLAIGTALGSTPSDDWFESLTDSEYQKEYVKSHFEAEKMKAKARQQFSQRGLQVSNTEGINNI